MLNSKSPCCSEPQSVLSPPSEGLNLDKIQTQVTNQNCNQRPRANRNDILYQQYHTTNQLNIYNQLTGIQLKKGYTGLNYYIEENQNDRSNKIYDIDLALNHKDFKNGDKVVSFQSKLQNLWQVNQILRQSQVNKQHTSENIQNIVHIFYKNAILIIDLRLNKGNNKTDRRIAQQQKQLIFTLITTSFSREDLKVFNKIKKLSSLQVLKYINNIEPEDLKKIFENPNSISLFQNQSQCQVKAKFQKYSASNQRQLYNQNKISEQNNEQRYTIKIRYQICIGQIKKQLATEINLEQLIDLNNYHQFLDIYIRLLREKIEGIQKNASNKNIQLRNSHQMKAIKNTNFVQKLTAYSSYLRKNRKQFENKTQKQGNLNEKIWDNFKRFIGRHYFCPQKQQNHSINIEQQIPILNLQENAKSTSRRQKMNVKSFKTKKITKSLSKQKRLSELSSHGDQSILNSGLSQQKSDVLNQKSSESFFDQTSLMQQSSRSDQFIRKVGDKFRIDFQNGDYYFGQMINGKYHGRGTYYTKQTGQTFQGEYLFGKIAGFGKKTDQQDNIYEGLYIDGQRNGYGRDIYSNGEQYTGYFKNGYKSGTGRYYYSKSEYYDGQWSEDKYHGQGIQFQKNGSFYKGTWVKDQRHGQGIYYSLQRISKRLYQYGQLIEEAVIYSHGKDRQQTPIQLFISGAKE